jgi:hypothetical protein
MDVNENEIMGEPFQQGKFVLRPRPQVREAGWGVASCWGSGCRHQGAKAPCGQGVDIIGDNGNGAVRAGLLLQGPWGLMRVDGNGGGGLEEGQSPRAEVCQHCH